AVEEQHICTHEQMLAAFDNVARDNCRTPMQWDASDGTGFTTGTPWIEVNPNHVEINAASQVDDPSSVFSFYRKLIELRHNMDIIVYGSYEPLLEDSDEIWAYLRRQGDQVITVACNYTTHEVPCDLFGEDDKPLIGNYDNHVAGVLQPYEAYATIR
ncbi:MAG: glucohydrolase, partial [Coriobacteriales bacterium]|nr:glucohydrolase [Coriobacteriales bacterium]